MKKLLTLLATALLLASLSGCAKKAEAKDITLAGSTSMEKLCEALAESYMAEKENATVNIEYTGSSAGIEALSKGTCDIGNSSRNLKDAELAQGISENIVAIDGIAVILDKDNILDGLSQDELKAIYTGTITNWKELGGNDQPIVVIGREAGSGTRDAFEELLSVKDKCNYAQELDSTGAVLAKVQATPGAIGYVSLDVVNDTVKAAKLDGVEASEATIIAGDYPLQRPFIMATKGRIETQSTAVQDWFAYIQSAAGKEIIKTVGLIPID